MFNKLNNDSEYAKLKSIKIWLQNIETKLVDCENFNELEIKADELNTIMLSEISDRKLKIITFYKTLEQNQLIIQKPIENIETQSQTSEKVSKLGKKRKIATFEGENEENQEIVPQVGKSKRKK